MGRLIPFYIPEGFKPQRKWLPASALGRILQFRPAEVKQSAWQACLQRSRARAHQLQLRPKGLAGSRKAAPWQISAALLSWPHASI